MRVFRGHITAAGKEQAICPTHYVGLVYCCHSLTTSCTGILKCKASNSLRGFFGDEFDALYHTLHNLHCVNSKYSALGLMQPTSLVLYSTVFSLCVLSNGDHVNPFITSPITLQRYTWAHIGIQVEHPEPELYQITT